MEKPLDVLQNLYQKTDLVRSILSLLLDAMTAGCDPWKTPYVVTVSHMAEMVEEIQTELLAATEELFREKQKVQKTDI
ncbi:unknown [Clostridium sp. CAG:505]|nr:unknown [Clostridium sp. CAG:505]